MDVIIERVRRLMRMGVRHRITKQVEDQLTSAIREVIRRLENTLIKTELRLSRLESEIQGIKRDLKYLEDEIAYLEKVMAKNDLFKVMVEEDETHA